MQRTRLGSLLVAFATALAVVAGLVLVGIGVVSSPSLASDAVPDLLTVPEIAEPIEESLARDLVAAAPAGVLDAEVARAVADRTVRDSAVVDDIARAAAEAQRQWRVGEQPVLQLDARVLTPAALTALRDVDLDLARSIGEDLEVRPNPVDLPMTTDRAETVGEIRTLATVGLLLVGALFVVGAVLDPRRDRTIRATSSALLVFGAVLVATPFLAGVPDLSTLRWGTASLLAMAHAGVVPLVVGGIAALALGAFLRAVASQVAPTITARIEARERAAVEPPPVSTGAQPARRSGRAVRQEAIDAFFAPGDEPDDDRPDHDVTPAAGDAVPAAPVPVDRRSASDDFARVVDAVDSEPHGPTEGDSEGVDAADAPDESSDSAADDAAEAVAAERREALERIDGRRRPLRTHLPR